MHSGVILRVAQSGAHRTISTAANTTQYNDTTIQSLWLNRISSRTTSYLLVILMVFPTVSINHVHTFPRYFSTAIMLGDSPVMGVEAQELCPKVALHSFLVIQ